MLLYFADILGDLIMDAIHNHQNQFIPNFFEEMDNIDILDDENFEAPTLVAPSMPPLEAESVVDETVSNENAAIDYIFSDSSSDENVDIEK